MKKTRLVSIIQFSNRNSIRVAENNGMKFERKVVFNDKEVALYALGSRSKESIAE